LSEGQVPLDGAQLVGVLSRFEISPIIAFADALQGWLVEVPDALSVVQLVDRLTQNST
jgi:hypothetical protein